MCNRVLLQFRLMFWVLLDLLQVSLSFWSERKVRTCRVVQKFYKVYHNWLNSNYLICITIGTISLKTKYGKDVVTNKVKNK